MTGSLRVRLEPGELRLSPGGTATVTASVVNGTDIVERLVIDGVGLEPATLQVSPAELRLLPGDEATVTLTLSLPAQGGPQAGERVAGIRFAWATSSLVEELRLTVQAAPAVELFVEPQTVKAGSSGRFSARVTNTGNTPLEVTFAGRDPEQVVAFAIAPPNLSLRPGEQRAARIQASAPRSWTGPPVLRTLIISARAGAVERTASVTFTQRSRLATGLLRAAGGATAAALIGGSILAAALLVGREPAVTDSAAAAAAAATTGAPSASEAATSATEVASASQPPPPAPSSVDPAPPVPPIPTGEPAPTAEPSPRPSPTQEPSPWPSGGWNPPFEGMWYAAPPSPDRIHRIELTGGEFEGELYVRAWEPCGVMECDMGTTFAAVEPDYYLAQWSDGVVLREMRIYVTNPDVLDVSVRIIAPGQAQDQTGYDIFLRRT